MRMMPMRVQRKRSKGSKGSRTPEGSAYVGRPGRFGNPFPLDYILSEGVGAARIRAVENHRRWLAGDPDLPDAIDLAGVGYDRTVVLAELSALRGLDLTCWCPKGAPCHADTLIELANKET